MTSRSNPTSREPENLPDASGGAYLRLPLFAGITATTEARYTGSQYCQHPDTGADVELGGGTLVRADVGRSWQVGRSRSGVFSRLEARAGVDNVADKLLYDQCGLPRPGRLLRLQLRIF